MKYNKPSEKPTFRCGDRVWLVMPYLRMAIKCTIEEVQSGIQVYERAEFKDPDGKVYPYQYTPECRKEGEIWFYWVDEPTGHSVDDPYQFRERGKPLDISEFTEYIIKTRQEAIEILKLFPIRKRHQVRSFDCWRESNKRFIGSTQIVAVETNKSLLKKWRDHHESIPDEVLKKAPIYSCVFPKRKKNEVIYRFEL